MIARTIFRDWAFFPIELRYRAPNNIRERNAVGKSGPEQQRTVWPKIPQKRFSAAKKKAATNGPFPWSLAMPRLSSNHRPIADSRPATADVGRSASTFGNRRKKPPAPGALP